MSFVLHWHNFNDADQNLVEDEILELARLVSTANLYAFPPKQS